jgi:MFS family permease
MLQCTVVLNLLIVAPIGDALMKSLSIRARQFGWVVSSYTFIAGISSILMARFAHRHDRKNLLLVFYFGLIVQMLLYGLAITDTPRYLAAPEPAHQQCFWLKHYVYRHSGDRTNYLCGDYFRF